MAGIVVVFDFDKTIIEPDSDNWVVDELDATDLFNQLLPTMPWNSLMDRMMKELHAQEKTLEDIKDVLRRVPIHPRIVHAIRKAHALGCDLRIVSDANMFFIDTILDHLCIKNCFSEINTNPSYIDEQERLTISPLVNFQSSPHGCNLCPPNMCKGMVIKRIQASLANDGKQRMIYLGDGSGDFCPSLKLNEGDFMMPRKNFPVWDLICENRDLVKSEIHEWTDGQDLERGMVIKRIQASLANDGKQRMIYLGDGSGDFCPSLKLNEGDFMMPRKNFPVWDLICENRDLVKSEIHEWTDGQDLERVLLKLIEKIIIQENDNSNSVQLVSSIDCKLEITIPVHEALAPVLKVHQ